MPTKSLRSRLKSGDLDLTVTPDINFSLKSAQTSIASSPETETPRRAHRRKILYWFALMAVLLASAGYQAYRNVNAFIGDVEWVEHTNHVLAVLSDSFSSLKDVESGRRGYVLTGKELYLEPTYAARQQVVNDLRLLRQLTSDSPRQLQLISEFERLVNEKLNYSDSIVALRQNQGFEAAREAALTGKGKQEMDAIRAIVTELQEEQKLLLQERSLAAHNSARATVLVVLIGIGLSFSILTIVYFMIRSENLRRLAVEAGLAASNGQLQRGFEEIERFSREMHLAGAMGEMLQSCLTFAEAGEVISKTIPHLLPGTAGSLCIINPSKNFVETVVTWGEDAPHKDCFAPDECWALRRGRLHFVSNKERDLACVHVTCSIPHGYLCVPLVAHGETLGVLHLCATDPAAISDSKQHIIRNVSEQFSLTLANLRLQQTLRTQSIHDPLTSLFNRRYMEASLEREMLRARRHETPLGVVMLDVDHFKRFNDTHGHGAGDALMQELARALKSCARGEDIVCRYGGEEFIIILPGASVEAARSYAQRIGETIRMLKVEYHGQTLGTITVSLGVAVYPEHADDHHELIRLADAALYRAKHSGRDRVVVAGQGSVTDDATPEQNFGTGHIVPLVTA